MAQIPRAALDFLTKEVGGLSADAKEKVSRLLESIEWRPDNIAECRAALVDALLSVMPTYTDAAAQAGADFYDAVRVSEVGEAMGAQAVSGFDPDAFEGAVRAFAQDMVDGKPAELFDGKVVDRVDRDIRRSANMSVAENARRDPLKPKYARVPGGGETCEFCIMLASRGAVYGTAEAASHAHPGCDCRVVPSFDGGHDIEGYDPDELYAKWKGLSSGKDAPSRGPNGGNPEYLGGAQKDDPMGWEEADNGHVNPFYGKEHGYSVNCQSCVVAFEARLRGYDVFAMPKRPGSMAERLSYQTNIAWVDPETGGHPEYLTNDNATTPRKYLRYIKEVVEPGGRYTLEFVWKGRGWSGHIVNLDMTESGDIRIKDNQRGPGERSEWVGDQEVLSYLRCFKFKGRYNGRSLTGLTKIIRIDGMLFDESVVNEILGAGK